MDSYKVKYENMETSWRNTEFATIIREIDLSKRNYHNMKVMKTHDEKTKPLMTETLGSQKALKQIFYLKDKGEKDNMLRLDIIAHKKRFSFKQ